MLSICYIIILMKYNRLTYFIDLDGTLFDQRGLNRVSFRNQTAILLLQNFADVVLSTGRSFVDARVKQVIKQLNIRNIICSSGAEVYINKKLKISNPIMSETLSKITDFAMKNKIAFVIYDSRGEHLFLVNKAQKFLAKIFMSSWMKTIETSKKYDPSNFDQVMKVSFILKSNLFTKKLIKKINSEMGEYVNAYSASKMFVIEITDISTNKALATKKYCEAKQIDLNDTVHIGDSMSDACLKGVVGKLVAMQNGASKLKAIADEIAPKHRRGGIYKYFANKSSIEE